MTSAAVSSKHNVLLGLGIGCTLGLSGVVPIEPNRIQIDDGDAVVEGTAAVAGGGGHTSLRAVTPERRQLSPADSATSSPPCMSENSHERLERPIEVGGMAVGVMAATRRGFDPMLAKLIHDNSDYSAVSEDALHGMPLTAGADLQPAILRSDMDHLEADETGGTKSAKDVRASVIFKENVTPTLPRTREEEGSNRELHDQGEDGSDENNGDDIIRRRIDRKNTDFKEEVNVPDEWRR